MLMFQVIVNGSNVFNNVNEILIKWLIDSAYNDFVVVQSNKYYYEYIHLKKSASVKLGNNQ